MHAHDLVIAEELRGRGLAPLVLGHLARTARLRRFETISLVAVRGSEVLWAPLGYRAEPEVELPASYGPQAVYMSMSLRTAPPPRLPSRRLPPPRPCSPQPATWGAAAPPRPVPRVAPERRSGSMNMLRLRDDYRRAQLAIAALFCFLGFQYATWVSRLPALKSRLDLSEAELGLLLMVCGVGAAVSFPLVAALMRRLGSRLLATLSALALGLVLLGLTVAPNYPVTLVVACFDGIAVGCLNVAMNAQGAALEVKYRRTAMSRLHATFSAGRCSPPCSPPASTPSPPPCPCTSASPPSSSCCSSGSPRRAC